MLIIVFETMNQHCPAFRPLSTFTQNITILVDFNRKTLGSFVLFKLSDVALKHEKSYLS